MLKGLDELQRRLKGIEDKARQLHGTRGVPLAELLNDRFVSSTTDFSTLGEMADTYGAIESADDLQTEAWSSFVAAHSHFADWNEMAHAAGAAWTKGKLGL